MRKGKVLITSAAVLVMAALIINTDYFSQFLTMICNVAIEAVSTMEGKDASALDAELNNLSVDKFINMDILNGEGVANLWLSEEQERKVSSFESDNLDAALKAQGIDRAKFDELRKQRAENLNDTDKGIMMAIRDSVPAPTPDTVMRRVIPVEDCAKYIGEQGYDTIYGFIAKNSDVSQLVTFNDVVYNLRLDYDGNHYLDNGRDYAYILFTTADVDKIRITYCEKWGGACKEKEPNTGNGFTWAETQVIPEYDCAEALRPDMGAELHQVIDGVDTVIAVFDGKHFMASVPDANGTVDEP